MDIRLSRLLIKATHVASAVTLLGVLFLGTTPAHAVSSWSPTLLVNTESFQTIDSGDGTTNIELRFGASTQTIKFLTTNKFQFSHAISVLGTMSGSSLNVDRNATVGGTLTATGTITGVGAVTAKGTLSGQTLRVTGNADVHGALSASGAVRTDSNLTINDDADTNDAVLTFGNSTGNQTLKFLNTVQKFQLSKYLSVLGTISGSSLNVDRNATVGGTLTVTGALLGRGAITAKGALSGATLTVDGNLTLRGQTYSAPTSQGANTFLKTDGAGNLTWSTVTVGNGSGGILSLHPQYPNAIYISSGSTYIGQLTQSGGTSALDNTYQWTSSRSTLQDYWIAVRTRLPDNFSSWDPVKPIEMRVKTGTNLPSQNHITVRMRDTAGALVALSTGAMVNTSFSTVRITGPEASGTWTPKSYFTTYIKMAANSTANAAANAGFLNFNFETTTP